MMVKSQFNKLAALALIILIPAGGCVWGSVLYDRTLEKEVIKKIEPGTTTRVNILEWFGPPEVLARKDAMITIPAFGKDQEEVQQIDSKVFFEHFSNKHALAEHHVVYYYFNEGEDINGFSIPIPIGTFFVSLPATFGDLQLSELWVLVNRETGKVDDYVFLERAEK